MRAGFCSLYIAKFTISRFVISRFECTAVLQWGALPLTFKTYTSWFIVPPRSIIEASLVVKRKIYNKVYFYFGHNNAAMTIKQKNLDIEQKKISKHVEQLELFVNWVIVGKMIENIIFSGNSSWINKIRNLKYFFVCFTFTIQKTSHAFLENERPYLTLAL